MGTLIYSLLARSTGQRGCLPSAVRVGTRVDACGAELFRCVSERCVPGQRDRAEMLGGGTPSPSPLPHPPKQIRIGCRAIPDAQG